MAYSSSSSLLLAATVRLRIVAINDVYEVTNLPRMHTFLSQLSPPPNAVVLAGDFLSPSILSSIDGGRGMVATLRAMGLTHASLGNHEQDLRLETLRERLTELSKSVEVMNTNMRTNVPLHAQWMTSVTHPYSMIQSSCERVKIAMIGLISDEPGVFRDNTFKSIPIRNMLDTYTHIYPTIVGGDAPSKGAAAHFCVAVTHASMKRDRELAEHIIAMTATSTTQQQEQLQNNNNNKGHYHCHRNDDHDDHNNGQLQQPNDEPTVIAGLIIGGHEHEPYDEIVSSKRSNTTTTNTGSQARSPTTVVRILKSGMEANAASLIDMTFELNDDDENEEKKKNNKDDDDADQQHHPKLVNIEAHLVDMSNFEPSIVVQNVVNKHMSVVQALEEEIVVDVAECCNNSHKTRRHDQPNPPSAGSSSTSAMLLDSKRTRFQQTSVGGIFCQMIKDELEVDVALMNGAVIKGGKIYENGTMSYAELKKELPFPTKMVVIPMKRWEINDAIYYSRNAIPDGGADVVDDNDTVLSKNHHQEIPRRGYLQVDDDYNYKNNNFVVMDDNDHHQQQHQQHEPGRQRRHLLSSSRMDDDDDDDILRVALPRNLLNGFCNNKPLMKIKSRLDQDKAFPGPDDYVPAIDSIVRNACKHRWLHIIKDITSFQEFDLNNDGILDRYEISKMMERMLGHEPANFLVDDMIAAIDTDNNGVIDMGEFHFLLAAMSTKQNTPKKAK